MQRLIKASCGEAFIRRLPSQYHAPGSRSGFDCADDPYRQPGDYREPQHAQPGDDFSVCNGSGFGVAKAIVKAKFLRAIRKICDRYCRPDRPALAGRPWFDLPIDVVISFSADCSLISSLIVSKFASYLRPGIARVQMPSASRFFYADNSRVRFQSVLAQKGLLIVICDMQIGVVACITRPNRKENRNPCSRMHEWIDEAIQDIRHHYAADRHCADQTDAYGEHLVYNNNEWKVLQFLNPHKHFAAMPSFEQTVESIGQLLEAINDRFIKDDLAALHPGRDYGDHLIHAMVIVARQYALYGCSLVQHVM